MPKAELSSLLYRSRTTAPLSEVDLERLVTSAQARNRGEEVTGLLLYDQGRFMQWLEGPSDSVDRVWRAICRDSRHTDISLLSLSRIPMRFFGENAMALGKRRSGSGDGRPRATVGLPAEQIESLFEAPQAASSVLAGLAWRPEEKAMRLQSAHTKGNGDRAFIEALVDRVIVPELLARHGTPVLAPPFIDPGVADLSRLLLATDPGAAFLLIDRLRADGRSLAQLCAGLFEPTARALGDLWQADDCSELDVTIGLAHLQSALRYIGLENLSGAVPQLPLSIPHAVLVVPMPQEPHLLGSAIASDTFWRAGWDVRCEFPENDAALSQLVHERWFDVLDLSLSASFTREHRLSTMAASIRAVHASSMNPGLVVIADGRVFNERPQAFAEVGADASSGSALELVSATRLVK